ncbi:Ppx/GppA phosphatase family protein [Sphingomonas sp.]|uniref:Ppx/GppA phosphatase family protein n=1 Tax=Sphingomonas sp. TaxID=28214 RepID=UPI000DB146D4|nr:Ppx/GppA phosphatase family protein [Sphingomonas sp.]PZU10419.1 MAG: exopolyphosphatase [Sphingomonas sp.]
MAERSQKAAPRPAAGGRASALPSRRNRGWHQRHTYAALDLGTNNCRLLIARPEGDGFVVVDAFSRIVRLGEGLAATGRLSDAAMDRAVAALAICAEKLKRRHVTLVRSVATEACRRATNGAEFIARVAKETGIRLEIISAEQEARLAVVGCHALLEPGDEPALVFDIGGGSTELVLLAEGDDPVPQVEDWFSAPWGVVSLSESEPHVGADEAELRASYARMKQRAADAFAPFAARLATSTRGPGRLLGTSGTVTTLASLHLDLPSYDRKKIDGLILDSQDLRTVNRRLSGMSVEARAALRCIGNERADLVVAGCAILEAILDLWPAERLSVADRGIREGILRGLMAADMVPA